MIVAIVVNWNGREDTLTCLESLVRSRPCPHIILIDNGSNDGSVTAVHTAFPQVEIISLPHNLHFAAGANRGIKRALQQNADFVWLLNNDLTILSDTLAEMVRVAISDPTIGIVGARLHHPVNPPGVIVGANCNFHTGSITEPSPPIDSSLDRLPVDYVWGCAMLIRTKTIRQVGLLDESLVAYFEDADFCLRARQHGWHVVTALQAVANHAGSKTANRVFMHQMWLRGRNWYRVFWRYASVQERPFLFIWLVTIRLPRLAWSALRTIMTRQVHAWRHAA